MSGKSEDIKGEKFGKLTAIRFDHIGKDHHYCWLFKCDCGGEIIARKSAVMGGQIKACKKCGYATQRKHGKKGTRIYAVWQSMKQRCFNKNHKSYKQYGGRGITVCNAWLEFEQFNDWAMANGYDENAEFMQCTLDRINVNGNYEPDNCRWTNSKVQSENTRTSRKIEYKNEIHCLSEWARILKIGRDKLKYKINKGFTIDEIVKELNKNERR